MNISQVVLFGDTGYMDGGVEVPSVDACPNLAEAVGSYTFDNVVPSKGRWFSEFKLKGHYTDLRGMSYLRMTYDGQTYYGWIDSVELLSDTVVGEGDESRDYSEVLVRWHIDQWRTYAPDATFGYGMVRRRPVEDTRPIQDIPFRYLEVVQTKTLFTLDRLTDIYNHTTDVIWACIISNDSGAPGSTNANIRVYAVPVAVDPYQDQALQGSAFRFRYGDGNRTTPSWHTILSGNITASGFTPSEIVYAFFSPVCPLKYTGSGTDSDPLVFTQDNIKAGTSYSTPGITMDRVNREWDLLSEEEIDLVNVNRSSEKAVWTFTDTKGNPIGTIPLNLTIECAKARFSIAPNYAYITVYMLNDKSKAHTMGLMVNLPCEPFSVAGNTYSDYVYSGQRDYDIAARRNANQMALYQGLIGSVSGATQGAMIGGLKEYGYVGSSIDMATPRSIMHASAFGALGAGAGIASAVGNYALNAAMADRLQSLEDQAHASQIDNISLAGGDIEWFIRGNNRPCLVLLSKDEYSKDVFDNQMELSGMEVSEPTADCTALCTGTGPVQIADLIVGGNIPVEAKQYIKSRFNSGVRLKEA